MIVPAHKPCILVVGTTGQIGDAIVRQVGAQDFHLSTPTHSELDITDESSIRRAFLRYRPDIVINAAAYTNVDLAETESQLAFTTNSTGPGLLAAACELTQTPFFHISTDYVFDGKNARPYSENDVVAPLNAYGKSKAAGEQAVRLATTRHIIIRTSWVFSVRGNNFVKSIIKKAYTDSTLSVVCDEWGNPTCADDVGKLLLFLSMHCIEQIRMGLEPRWGTYHFCNEKTVSRLEFAEAIVEAAAKRGMPKRAVLAMSSSELNSTARRPKNSSLDCALIRDVFGVKTRSWESCLKETLEKLI
jgi:dTDP-4-dehydrorhamnose reductase